MFQPATLSDFDAAGFLRDHWQRSPALLRGALAGFLNPIEPDELAGLALEEEAESRLILHHRKDNSYQLEHGPFEAGRFSDLPDSDWTLLVQAVDQWSAEVAALIEPFRALVPDWRIDDVMVSYAAIGGGVGPHYDHYDVFLVQGLGQRRWRIGPHVDPATAGDPLDTGSPLRLMSEFPVSAEYLLEPGDILYVPPGWGHWGEAASADCMTYSVGLRAPDQAELAGHWADRVVAQCSPFDRYVDAPGDGTTADTSASPWLADTVVNSAFELMQQRMADREQFALWLGEWLSEPKYPEHLIPPPQPVSPAQLAAALAEEPSMTRNPGSRLLLQQHGRGADLCADGQRHPLQGDSLALAERLCALPRHGVLCFVQPPTGESLDLLAALYNQGSLGQDCLLSQEIGYREISNAAPWDDEPTPG